MEGQHIYLRLSGESVIFLFNCVHELADGEVFWSNQKIPDSSLWTVIISFDSATEILSVLYRKLTNSKGEGLQGEAEWAGDLIRMIEEASREVKENQPDKLGKKIGPLTTIPDLIKIRN